MNPAKIHFSSNFKICSYSKTQFIILLKFSFVIFFFFSQLNEPGKDSLQHTDLWRLLGLYIENTQDIIDNSTALNLSEYKLLGKA